MIQILVIEDDDSTKELIVEALSKSFPLANVHGFKNFVQESFEEIIKENKYDIITIDGYLGDWTEHPIFYKNGKNLIPFIKENSPKTIIIAMSSGDDLNKEMMEVGASMTIKKTDFLKNGFIKKLFNSDLTLREVD